MANQNQVHHTIKDGRHDIGKEIIIPEVTYTEDRLQWYKAQAAKCI